MKHCENDERSLLKTHLGEIKITVRSLKLLTKVYSILVTNLILLSCKKALLHTFLIKI